MKARTGRAAIENLWNKKNAIRYLLLAVLFCYLDSIELLKDNFKPLTILKGDLPLLPWAVACSAYAKQTNTDRSASASVEQSDLIVRAVLGKVRLRNLARQKNSLSKYD